MGGAFKLPLNCTQCSKQTWFLKIILFILFMNSPKRGFRGIRKCEWWEGKGRGDRKILHTAD